MTLEQQSKVTPDSLVRGSSSIDFLGYMFKVSLKWQLLQICKHWTENDIFFAIFIIFYTLSRHFHLEVKENLHHVSVLLLNQDVWSYIFIFSAIFMKWFIIMQHINFLGDNAQISPSKHVAIIYHTKIRQKYLPYITIKQRLSTISSYIQHQSGLRSLSLNSA